MVNACFPTGSVDGSFDLGKAGFCCKLGSIAGPVINANGRLTFEDDLRSEGLIYTQHPH